MCALHRLWPVQLPSFHLVSPNTAFHLDVCSLSHVFWWWWYQEPVCCVDSRAAVDPWVWALHEVRMCVSRPWVGVLRCASLADRSDLWVVLSLIRTSVWCCRLALCCSEVAFERVSSWQLQMTSWLLCFLFLVVTGQDPPNSVTWRKQTSCFRCWGRWEGEEEECVCGPLPSSVRPAVLLTTEGAGFPQSSTVGF